MMMKVKDNSRRWLWWLLAVVVAPQLYFVRELLAAFALFALGFAVIACLIGGLYMLQKSLEVAVARLADSNHSVMNMALGKKGNQIS
jgi:predicted membrane protein